VTGIHIGEYKWWSRILPPKREREILMKKSEILRLELKIKEMWATMIPLQVYSKGNLIKVRVALVKWKKTWQKKETLKNRDLDREMARKFKL
jgi:SsrA-binding protein